MNKPTFIYATHLTTATAAATDTASGYAAANVLEGCEDTAWRPANTSGSKSLTIALGGLLPIGQVAILGNYLNGVTLTISGSVDGSTFTTLSAAAVISSSSFITAWRSFGESYYRHIRVTFSGFSSSFDVAYVACCRSVVLPWLTDGHDPDVFQPTGTHLIGPAGTYLGATQQNTLRNLTLDFGQITPSQYTPFQLWAEYCVMTMRPFFYVPDSGQPESYFGWVEARYKFSAPYKGAARKLSVIPFVGRFA